MCRAKTCVVNVHARESNKTGQWMKRKKKEKKKECLRISEALRDVCTLFAWTFVLTTLKLDILWSCSLKQSGPFNDQKLISSTFKALKSDSWNSRVFKTRTNPVSKKASFLIFDYKTHKREDVTKILTWKLLQQVTPSKEIKHHNTIGHLQTQKVQTGGKVS